MADTKFSGPVACNSGRDRSCPVRGRSWRDSRVCQGDGCHLVPALGRRRGQDRFRCGDDGQILDDNVTYAKIQNVSATDRLLGRDTASSGDIEELTVSGGIEFSGSTGIQTSAFTGDVTKSAGGTAQTIANDAVTYAKIQNVSAADRLLGRGNGGGSGDVQEISLGTGLALSGTTLNASGTTPAAHASSHMSAGGDPIRIDELKVGTDVTTLDATATEHGLLRKLDGTSTNFLRGDGTVGCADAYRWRVLGAGWNMPDDGNSVYWKMDLCVRCDDRRFHRARGYSEIRVLMRGITASTSVTRQVVVSIDNGSNFLTSSGDYVGVDSAGVEANTTALGMFVTSNASARSGETTISSFNSAEPKYVKVSNRTDIQWFVIPTANALNAVRVRLSGAGNITGGIVWVWGR